MKFRLQIPDDNSTTETQLRLPLVLISRFLNSLEFEDICISAFSCLTNSCHASIRGKICWRPRDFLLPERQVDWGPRCSFGPAWGMGTLAPENDRVALPGWSGGVPRTAEHGPGRGGNSRQFSKWDLCTRFEDPGSRTSAFDVYGRIRDNFHFRVKKWCILFMD